MLACHLWIPAAGTIFVRFDCGLKQGPCPGSGVVRHRCFTWLAGTVVILALIGMKAFGIITAAFVQPEVTMGIINNVFIQKVMFSALIETTWSISVNLVTNATSV